METYFCDRLRSCDHDRRRSQTIAEDRTYGWSPYDRGSQIPCDQLPLCDHMEIKVLRSAIETHPIMFRVLPHDSTLVCLMVGTVYVATIISLSFGGIYGKLLVMNVFTIAAEKILKTRTKGQLLGYRIQKRCFRRF